MIHENGPLVGKFMNIPKSSSLTAEAYAKIRAEILSCRLAPAQKLIITDVCDSYGFSLGAVREALSRLTSEGVGRDRAAQRLSRSRDYRE